jgi:protein O-mannosyl-transferase
VSSAGANAAQEAGSGARAPLGWLEKQTFLLAFLLLGATMAVYGAVKQLSFVSYDDREYVTRNLQVQTGLDWDTVQWAFTTTDADNWHPLTWLSHALDCQLFGLNSGAHHETNLFLHSLNVLLLFLVLQRATGYTLRSSMVAALFALHPINVESVAWVAERKNLLSMLFFLLALAAYRWYASKPRLTRYAVVAGLFALGLMSKPQVITLPCVLLLWDYWPLQRLRPAADSSSTLPARGVPWLIVEKLPLVAMSAASGVITVIAQRSGGAMSGLSSYPRALRLENAIISYVRYLGKAIWPAHLANFYPRTEHHFAIWQVSAATLLLAAITCAVFLARRRRYLVVGWLWFLGTLVPMIGLIQVGAQAMADRYAYLPFIGLFLMICWGAAEWVRQKRVSRLVLAGACAIVLLALAMVAHRQVRYWSNSLTLWSHAAQVTRGNWMAEDNLGGLLLEQNRLEAAMPYFYRAAEMNPSDPTSNLDVGAYEQRNGNLAKAIESYKRVLVSPQTPPKVRAMAQDNLERAYAEQKMKAAGPPE